MKSSTRKKESKKMETNIDLPDPIVQTHSTEELRQMAIQGVVLIDYLQGNISKGRAGELLRLDYEGITQLLKKLNIPSMRALPTDLDKIDKGNSESLAQEIGI